MKRNRYKVYFRISDTSIEPVYISAFNQKEAEILAMAERIKEGKDYTVYKVEVGVKCAFCEQVKFVDPESKAGKNGYYIHKECYDENEFIL